MTWAGPPTYADAVRTALPSEKRAGKIDLAMPELRLFRAGETLRPGGDVAEIAPDSDMVLAQRENGLPAGDPNRDVQVACPGCGVFVPANALFDVRTLPAELTQGQKWACGGCQEQWRREGRTAAGKPFATSVWLELHGCDDQALVDHHRAVEAARAIPIGGP